MSAPHEPWLERWWPLLLILFALVFTFFLTLFRPQHEWSAVPPSSSIHQAALDRVAPHVRS